MPCMNGRAAGFALLCACVPALAAPPARPSKTDLRFKAACLAFLEQKAPRNPSAKAAAAFYRAHPDADLRVASPEEMGRYFGVFNPPWEQVGGYVDPPTKILFMIESPKYGVVLRDASGRLLPAPDLDKALAKIAARLVHETSHLMVYEDFQDPLLGLVQNELLAHVREARYLERELTLTPELRRVAERYQYWQLLKTSGGAGALDDRIAADFSRYGQPMMTQVVILADYRSGPRAFGNYLRGIYGPADGYWSVYGSPRRQLSNISARLKDPKMPRVYRDYLLVQVDFWSDAGKVAAARRYFDRRLPGYKDLRWPGEE